MRSPEAPRPASSRLRRSPPKVSKSLQDQEPNLDFLRREMASKLAQNRGAEKVLQAPTEPRPRLRHCLSHVLSHVLYVTLKVTPQQVPGEPMEPCGWDCGFNYLVPIRLPYNHSGVWFKHAYLMDFQMAKNSVCAQRLAVQSPTSRKDSRAPCRAGLTITN